MKSLKRDNQASKRYKRKVAYRSRSMFHYLLTRYRGVGIPLFPYIKLYQKNYYK